MQRNCEHRERTPVLTDKSISLDDETYALRDGRSSAYLSRCWPVLHYHVTNIGLLTISKLVQRSSS